LKPNSYPHDPNNKMGQFWTTSQRSDYSVDGALAFATKQGAPERIHLKQGDRAQFDTHLATTNFQHSYVPINVAPRQAHVPPEPTIGRRPTNHGGNDYATTSGITQRCTTDTSDYMMRPPSKVVTAYLRTKSNLPQGAADTGVHMEPVTTTSFTATRNAGGYPLIPPVGSNNAQRHSNVDNHNDTVKPTNYNRITHTTQGADFAGVQVEHREQVLPKRTKGDRLLASDPFQPATISSTKSSYLGLYAPAPAPAQDTRQKWEHHSKPGDSIHRHATSMKTEYTGSDADRRSEIRPHVSTTIAPWHEAQDLRPIGAVVATSLDAYSKPESRAEDRVVANNLRASNVQFPLDTDTTGLYRTTHQDYQWPNASGERASGVTQQTSSLLLH
jgi:hypothetical protein